MSKYFGICVENSGKHISYKSQEAYSKVLDGSGSPVNRATDASLQYQIFDISRLAVKFQKISNTNQTLPIIILGFWTLKFEESIHYFPDIKFSWWFYSKGSNSQIMRGNSDVTQISKFLYTKSLSTPSSVPNDIHVFRLAQLKKLRKTKAKEEEIAPEKQFQKLKLQEDELLLRHYMFKNKFISDMRSKPADINVCISVYWVYVAFLFYFKRCQISETVGQ